MSLAERRADAESRLDGLLSARNAVVMAGGKPDHVAIADVEAEITALEAASAEETRLRREEAAKEHSARRASLAEGVALAEARRCQAIAKVEKATGEMVAAIRSAVEASVDIASFTAQLGLKPGWAQQRTIDDLSEHLSVALSGIHHPSEFGSFLRLRPGPNAVKGRPWLEANRALAATEIAAIVTAEKGTP